MRPAKPMNCQPCVVTWVALSIGTHSKTVGTALAMARVTTRWAMSRRDLLIRICRRLKSDEKRIYHLRFETSGFNFDVQQSVVLFAPVRRAVYRTNDREKTSLRSSGAHDERASGAVQNCLR